jgi:hypothetical protein
LFSVAGALRSTASALLPSVTTSARFFITIGVTDDVDLGQLLDERQDRIDLAPQVLDLVVGNRDPRQMRNTADGGGVNGHRRLGPLDRCLRI